MGSKYQYRYDYELVGGAIIAIDRCLASTIVTIVYFLNSTFRYSFPPFFSCGTVWHLVRKSQQRLICCIVLVHTIWEEISWPYHKLIQLINLFNFLNIDHSQSSFVDHQFNNFHYFALNISSNYTLRPKNLNNNAVSSITK